MGIQYFEEEHIFKLDTKNSSYLIGIADERYIGHIYYGSKLSDHRLSYLMRTEEAPFVPSKNLRDKISFFDTFPMEYPTGGIGDFRESAIEICSDGGYTALEFVYETYEIIPGKVKLNGLPATFGDGADCTTLKLYAMDPVIGLEVILNYNVFEDTDCITRSVCIVNQSKLPITLTKVISASFDMNQEDYE